MADDPNKQPEVLSQSEVESILASIQSGAGGFEEQVQVLGSGGKDRKQSAHTIQNFDFRTPVFLSPAQMRRLRIKHEDFIRGLSASLSLYLRSEFTLQMAKLETIPYQQMLETLPVPSHLTLFKLKPMNGVCLFELAPRLGLTVLDRMMGGPGHSIKIEREFTDIEVIVLQKFIRLILKEYTESWLKYQPLEFEIIEHENTAKFLTIVKPEEIMLVLEIEARIGDCVAGMRLIFPYFMLEGLVEQLMKEVSAELRDNPFKPTPLLSDLNSASYNIPVPISAHWRGLSMTLREIQNLEVGDVIFVDKKIVDDVSVDLGTIPKFSGQLDRSKSAVRVCLKQKYD